MILETVLQHEIGLNSYSLYAPLIFGMIANMVAFDYLVKVLVTKNSLTT